MSVAEPATATLAEFLLARIAEDEEKSRDLLNRAQRTQETLQEVRFLGRELPGWFDWPNVIEMCERALVDSGAKREIVAYYAHGGVSNTHVLRSLALPYASRPDYRTAWLL